MNIRESKTMAKALIVPKSRLFQLVMSAEDMRSLECICQVKEKNYYEVVEACFHAGLVAITVHSKCHNCERKPDEKEKNQEKNICPECGQSRIERENEPQGIT